MNLMKFSCLVIAATVLAQAPINRALNSPNPVSQGGPNPVSQGSPNQVNPNPIPNAQTCLKGGSCSDIRCCTRVYKICRPIHDCDGEIIYIPAEFPSRRR